MSKNAEGWIRHRGGKCPVEVGTLIDIRCRDGLVRNGVPCGKDFTRTASMFWSHEGDGAEVMAYRLHKPAEQVEPNKVGKLTIEVTARTEGVREVIEDMQMHIDQIDGPIKWRDRITEIDAATNALTAERADLVQKLASEGFALIGLINDLLTEAAQKHEDMSDWRNWKVGDLLEMVKASEWEGMTNGKLYEFASPENGYNFAVVDDGGELRSVCIGSNDYVTGDFKWHSRPSA